MPPRRQVMVPKASLMLTLILVHCATSTTAPNQPGTSPIHRPRTSTTTSATSTKSSTSAKTTLVVAASQIQPHATVEENVDAILAQMEEAARQGGKW